MPNRPRKEDRRIQRTRTVLREALMSLIAEKGYADITIQEITARAMVARTTFYLHYADKDDLLFTSMREMYEELIAKVPKPTLENLKNRQFDFGDSSGYRHVAQYAGFYRMMFGEHGSPAFMSRARQLIAKGYEEQLLRPIATQTDPTLPLDLVSHVCAGIQVAMISWWVANGLKQTPEEMNAITGHFLTKGMLWALGIEETP